MLKCAIFADFLDFENGCCYLNTIACKKRKNTWVSCIFAQDHTLLYWFKYIIVLHSDGHGRKNMLKCGILADFLDFENGCCYLNTIARKRRKNTWVSCIFA